MSFFDFTLINGLSPELFDNVTVTLQDTKLSKKGIPGLTESEFKNIQSHNKLL